ncbi:peptidyl-tRNA hydrolase [Campylobacterota bacterium]|nr:peptidyl-tRNA hydrolase [Campylobacterota bacterium]
MTLIVGLGNPTDRYKFTRHNAGFLAADRAIERLKTAAASRDFSASQNSSVSKNFKGELFKIGDILILKPLTFMNLSGESAESVKNFYKPEKTIVIHDDLDLPFGALRFKIGGSSGGHNGLKSLDAAIGADYLRVRMGISRPQIGADAAEYVLGNWSENEAEKLPEFTDKAAEAAITLIETPIERVKTELSFKGYLAEIPL